MRIIGGTLKRRKLKSVKGQGTRPTSDRLRESLFNILSFRVKGAVVLDLFAGTGALGIEALSRGAQRAVFIEKSPGAAAVIGQNIEAFGIAGKARVIRWDAAGGLACIKGSHPPFDMVFMDPPYDRGFVLPALAALHESGALCQGAEIVVEHTPAEDLAEDPPQFSVGDRRLYGKTAVTFLTYTGKA